MHNFFLCSSAYSVLTYLGTLMSMILQDVLFLGPRIWTLWSWSKLHMFKSCRACFHSRQPFRALCGWRPQSCIHYAHFELSSQKRSPGCNAPHAWTLTSNLYVCVPMPTRLVLGQVKWSASTCIEAHRTILACCYCIMFMLWIETRCLDRWTVSICR